MCQREELTYRSLWRTSSTTGEFTDEDGNPYQYMGHWSWIYFDNNECACDEDGMGAWDFIAECLER